MDRKPFLQVNGSDGADQVPVWGSKLIGVKLVSRMDDESDEATFMFTNAPPYAPAPAEGTPYTVRVGWSAEDVAITGIYTLQRVHYTGSPAKGEQVHYICRAGDFIDPALKQVDSQHFGADNGNTTLGDVFRNLFASSGIPVDVAPEIASRPIPGGYLLRHNQSAADFGTDLANDNGAAVKAMGGKIIVLQRDAGQSVSGSALGTVSIRRDACYEYDVEAEPRFQYQGVTSTWFDNAAGRLKTESGTSFGTKGGTDGLPHPAATQDQAQAINKAVAQEWGRFTGTGLFVTVGDPSAVAGASVSCSGFPDAVNAIKWQASTVTHDIVPDSGWITTTETETQPG